MEVNSLGSGLTSPTKDVSNLRDEFSGESDPKDPCG